MPWKTSLDRWPLALHLLIALAVMGMAVGAFVALLPGGTTSGRQLAEVQRLSMQLQALQSGRPSSAASPSAWVPVPATQADDVIRDVGQLARKLGIHVTLLSVLPQLATPHETAKIQFTLQASGNYTALKAWLSQLLARHDQLALANLHLRAGAAGAAQLESQLTLILYVQD